MKSLVKSLLKCLDLEVVRLSSPIRADHRWSLNLFDLAARELSGKLDRRMRVLQIGANDGEDEDPVKSLIDDDLVEAILVEPLPIPFTRLSERYADNPMIHPVNVAIAEENGRNPLYVLAEKDGTVSQSFSKMATLDQNLARKRLSAERRRLGRELDIITEFVETTKISDLLREMGWHKVDAIVVDAEGRDINIVREILDEKIDCEIIQFESICISRRDYPVLIKSLVAAGFVTARSGFDTIAVRQ